MKYISTRGDQTRRSFSEILLEGLAPDGGLYLPKSYPQVDAATLATLIGRIADGAQHHCLVGGARTPQYPRCHMIFVPRMANADPQLLPKIGIQDKASGSVAVMTLTPGEAAIIGGDIAAKAADVELAYVDRFSGSLLLVGQLADIDQGLQAPRGGLCFGVHNEQVHGAHRS